MTQLVINEKVKEQREQRNIYSNNILEGLIK